MSDAFLELLAFILVAGLIFFNDSNSKYADFAKLILSVGCAVWLVAHSTVFFVEKIAGWF